MSKFNFFSTLLDRMSQKNIPSSLYNLSGEIDKLWVKNGNKRRFFLCVGLQRNLFSICTRGCITFLKETSFHYIFPSSFSFALALDTLCLPKYSTYRKVGICLQGWKDNIAPV